MKWDLFNKKTENTDKQDLESAFNELELDNLVEEKVEEEAFVYMPALHIDENTSVIQSDTAITGDIECGEDLIIYGTVQGNVSCKAKLSVYGTITGNIKAHSFEMSASTVYGDIQSSTECVLVDEDAMVQGNIVANACDIKGRVKGNIDSKTSLTIGSKSVIQGDIMTGLIQVNQGAILRGQVIMNQTPSYKGER